jgi:hypothetical protein
MTASVGRVVPVWRKWLLRLLPYALAVTAIAVILSSYPPSQIASEMARGHVWAMTPYALLLVLGGICLLAASDRQILRAVVTAPASSSGSSAGTAGHGTELTFWRVLRARAGVLVLALFGYGAGVGGHGVWVARVTGCGAGFASGIALYVMATDLIAVCIVVTLSVWLAGAEVARSLAIFAPAAAAVLLTLKLVGPAQLLFGEERLPAVFRPWVRVSRSRALSAVMFRTINIYWITLCAWAGANAFGMPIPLVAMTTYFPIVLLVGAMPVNVAGFGAVQGAWLLLAPWAASGEQVLAFSTLWSLMVGVGVLLRGMPFVRGVAREIDRGAPVVEPPIAS